MIWTRVVGMFMSSTSTSGGKAVRRGIAVLKATLDIEDRAGNVSSEGRGEVDCGVADVFRRSKAAKRDPAADLGLFRRRWCKPLQSLGTLDGTGRDCVHSNARRPPFHCQRAHERVDACFGSTY